MSEKLDYDTLIIGAGIGGMQTAIDLGDMGHKVLMVEKQIDPGSHITRVADLEHAIEIIHQIRNREINGKAVIRVTQAISVAVLNRLKRRYCQAR